MQGRRQAGRLSVRKTLLQPDQPLVPSLSHQEPCHLSLLPFPGQPLYQQLGVPMDIVLIALKQIEQPLERGLWIVYIPRG